MLTDGFGCFSAGDTLDEAILNAKESIDFHLEALADDGQEIPKATAFNLLSKNKEYKCYIWAVVDIDISNYLGASQKINVTLPGGLISRIDSEVNRNKIYKSRSDFLQQAAIKALSA